MRKIWIYAICGLALILGATQLQAQPLVPGPALELSEIFGNFPRQVEIGDANGDGELDLLTDQGVTFLADGAGGYEPQQVGAGATRPIAFEDLNGDGLDDLIGIDGMQIVVLLGDLNDDFAPAGFSPLELVEFSLAIEVADFNGDGLRDLAAIARNGSIELFVNDGVGGLTAAAGLELNTASTINLSASGDINNDGISDVAIVASSDRPNQILIFLGDGAGGFTEAPGSPVEFSTSSISTTQTIAFHDMDGDGNEDLIGLSLNSSAVGVFSGDGAGRFSELEESPFFFSSNDVPEFLEIGDMNSDDIPDAVTANRVRSVSVMINAGDGTLSEPPESPFPAGDQAGHLSLGDLNNDGSLDVVTANNVSDDLSLLFGDGTGVLQTAPASPLVLDAGVRSPVVRDMNGDDIADLMFLRESQDNFVFVPGVGEGRFGESVATAVGDQPISIAVDDLNGDGYTDVVIALREFNDRSPDTENGDIAVLLGDGAGGFMRIDHASLPEDSGTIDLAITEFDGNSAPDLFVRNGAGIRIFSGNGDGTFSDFGFVEFSDFNIAIDVLSIDVDQDGYLDIVTSFQSSEELVIFLGSPTGDFSEAPSSPVSVPGAGLVQIIAADFNNDELAELVTVNLDGSAALLMNMGDAQFGSPLPILPPGSSGRLTTDDFDGDGEIDILSSFSSGYRFLVGDGTGGFTADPEGPFSSGFITDFAVAAIDSDTVADAVFLERTSFPSKYRIQTLLSTRAQAGLSPTMLDFLEVEVGETSNAQDVVISSTGDRGLEVESISLTGANSSQFAIESDVCSGEVISPGTDCVISIVFSPLEPGAKEAGLEILSNAETSPDSVALSGDAILVNQPFLDLTSEEVDFGEVAIGGSSNRTTTVENIGTAALSIGNLSLSGSGAEDYTLNVDNCSSTTLEPSDTCTYNVGVAPSQTGLREALFEIPSNAFSSPDQQGTR